MLGHKHNSKTMNYLGAKSDGLSKYTLGNKDHQTSHSLHNFKSTSDSSNGIYNNSNSKDAQNEPLKRTRF